jgi:hypothetical protein
MQFFVAIPTALKVDVSRRGDLGALRFCFEFDLLPIFKVLGWRAFRRDFGTNLRRFLPFADSNVGDLRSHGVMTSWSPSLRQAPLLAFLPFCLQTAQRLDYMPAIGLSGP